MRIQESRKMFDAYKMWHAGDRIDRLEKIIERAEKERSLFDSDKKNDKQMILPIEILVEELIKSLFKLNDVNSVVSYDPLFAELSKYDLSLTKACNAAGVTPAARTAIGLGLPIHLEYLMKLATLLDCDAHKLFYEIDAIEHRRRVLKKAQIEHLSKQYAQLIDGLIQTPSDSYLEALSETDLSFSQGAYSFGRGGLSFGNGITLEQAEQYLGITDKKE